jgi:hypothetical protein
VNDAPSITLDDAPFLVVAEGQTATRTGSFFDPDGNATVTLSASSGTLALNKAAGTWTLTLPATDGPTDSRTVVITAEDDIAPEEGVSFFVSVANLPPEAFGQTVTRAGDGPISIHLYASDPVGDSLNYTIQQVPAHGVLSNRPPNVVYIPAANYVGSDLFRFQVFDKDGAESKVATVQIIDPRNSVLALDDEVLRLNNTREARVHKSVLFANDSGSPAMLQITSVDQASPSGATVTLSGDFVIYTAPTTRAGDGKFSYTISDGIAGHTNSATVFVLAAIAGAEPVGVIQSGGDILATFRGIAGQKYQIQYTPSLDSPVNWNDFDPAARYTAPANGEFTHTDSNTQEPARFYRAIPTQSGGGG